MNEASLDLEGHGGFTSEVNKKEVPVSIQQGTGEALFDFIAAAVKELQGNSNAPAPLGYTFSFPIDQKSLNSGILMRWTKNFTATGVVREDVVEILHKSFTKIGVNLKVTALINDTVGTMLAGCYQEVGSNCFCGVIVGTGSNCCYIEKVDNIKKYNPTPSERGGNMIVNTECGNFGSRPDALGRDLPMTEFDIELDNNSNNKNQQILEKQIAGMYLGEITRLVLSKYIKSALIFSNFSNSLTVPYKFTTEQMSQIEGDGTVGLNVVSQVLAGHGITSASPDELKFVKSVVHLVGVRAAQLSAVQIAGIYKQVATSRSLSSAVAIAAVDGSVFEKYPNFAKTMGHTLDVLVGENKIRLVLARDGSGNGAALASVAAF